MLLTGERAGLSVDDNKGYGSFRQSASSQQLQREHGRRAYTEASPMADESTIKDLDIKFRTAYLIAKDEMSFTAFLSPVKLQKRNGLPITDSYCSDGQCAKMIAEI